MICPNCGSEFSGLRCPYCGTENEHIALHQQRREVGSRYQAIARMLRIPAERAQRLVRWISVLAVVLAAAVLLGLGGAILYGRFAPEIQFRRQEAVLQELEALLDAGDYAGMTRRLEKLDDSYMGVYDKYTAIRDIYRDIANVEKDMQEDIRLSLAVQEPELLRWDIGELCFALAACRSMEQAGWVYGEKDQVEPLRSRAEELLQGSFLLTPEEMEAGMDIACTEERDFDALAQASLQRLLGGTP